MEYLIYRGKVRSFDTQTYLQVYVYVTLCHGSLQVSREYLRFAYAVIAYEHEVVPRRGDVQQLPQFSDVSFDVCHFRIVLCCEDRSL